MLITSKLNYTKELSEETLERMRVYDFFDHIDKKTVFLREYMIPDFQDFFEVFNMLHGWYVLRDMNTGEYQKHSIKFLKGKFTPEIEPCNIKISVQVKKEKDSKASTALTQSEKIALLVDWLYLNKRIPEVGDTISTKDGDLVRSFDAGKFFSKVQVYADIYKILNDVSTEAATGGEPEGTQEEYEDGSYSNGED
jgi:hypothetical protein